MSCEIALGLDSGADSGFANGPAHPAQVIPVSPIPLLAGMSPRESTEILSLASHHSFAPNESLFLEGQPANCLILVEAGRVKLSRNVRDGSELILRICSPGEIVDAYSDSTNSHHTCSARAMAHCRVLIWDSTQAFALGIHYPQIRTNLLRILTERLDELEERCCEIASERCEPRLARTLLKLVDSIGRTNPDGARVVLSRTELAQMIGVTVFTISRTLSKWAKCGIVSRRRDAVIVRRVGELRALIHDDIYDDI